MVKEGTLKWHIQKKKQSGRRNEVGITIALPVAVFPVVVVEAANSAWWYSGRA